MVLVGPGTVIARGATLVGPTVLGAECVIEPGAVVCDSVLWNSCRVRRGAAVNHCILGDAVEVKPEAIVFRAALGPEAGWGGRLSGAVRLDSLLFPVTAGGDDQDEAKLVEAGRPSERPLRVSAKVSA
jgi:NDP-sugar pyrophosphorylase family protein